MTLLITTIRLRNCYIFFYCYLWNIIIFPADDFPQCKRDDPELDKCVVRAVDEVKPRLLNGIPEVNIPALEPFNVPTLKLDRTAPNLRIKATLKNTKAYGGSNFKIEKLK